MARSRRGRRPPRPEARRDATVAPIEPSDDAQADGLADDADAVASRRTTADRPRDAATSNPARSPALTAPAELGIEAWVARFFIPTALLLLLVAAAFRLPELAINPFHHDEGVNGFFTKNLVREGVYRYDPANYHGPTLYYFALVSEILFGLTTEAMRLVPVLFGLLTIGGVLALRPLLGSIPVLTAGALLAVSPGAVYVSRYFIHEMLLVAFSVTLVLSVLLYLRSGRPAWFLSATASAAFIFATKETGIITVVVLAIAAVVSGVYLNLRAGRPPFASSRAARTSGPRPKPKRPAKSIWVDGVEYRAAPEAENEADRPSRLAGRGPDTELVVAGAIVFACVYVLFFSSFFTNFPKGLADSLATFTIWTSTSGETQVQPFQQYLVWMLRADAPILILGTVGGLIAAVRARDRLWVLIGLWAAGVTLAYSLVAYKTPWIIVNMLLPLALLAGHAVRELIVTRGPLRPVRALAPVLVIAAVGFSSYQAYDLNFRHYDDETYPYVFVHTTREALDLVADIEATGARVGTGLDTGVTIVTGDYWPLPWYLRDYPKAGFWGFVESGDTNVLDAPEPLVLSNVTQQAEVTTKIGSTHSLIGTYTLRPGVELELYLRNDLVAAAP
jgi:uncharacterized protein (TIGR03663 family)